MRTFHRVRKNRIRKRSRTLPIPGHEDYGDGRDADRYFKCWNCGFICDSERDATNADSDGQKYSQWTDVYSSDGSVLIWYNEGGVGCPLCNTLNWKGDQ